MFTARYALSPYIKQIRFVFKGLNEQIALHIHCVLTKYHPGGQIKTNELGGVFDTYRVEQRCVQIFGRRT
jgi:hypothetical protein